ncbi:hypothetical protein B0J11DRAFT_512659 [Dendryphion nanum]|uniref:Uncharacterized protein n=1 Tax=Dendryphion nanum TaxID=256645 RepID=A0A9P9I857_9PLEO|nr:hypothetical protein B0J11DRAFT_512659 [Dendryphion nanum]
MSIFCARMRVLEPFVYLNDAGPRQDPTGSYGTKQQLQESKKATRLYKDDSCEDNMQYHKDLLAIEQDCNVLEIFADHRHYAFPLLDEQGEQDEDAVIDGIMVDVAPGLSKQLQASKEEARELGTCPCMNLVRWQHVVLESPVKFL